MAYSNWGAFVYKDGVRRRDKEDVGVFDVDESDVPSGFRIFANLMKNREAGTEGDLSLHSHHAVLGDGRVRLCGYESVAALWYVDSEGMRQRAKLPEADYDKDEYELNDQSGELILGGETWGWWFNQFNGNMIDLKLTEPDGTVWTSRCGYMYGAGHMEDGDEPRVRLSQRGK